MKIGRYEVIAKVGETGMSVVYRARGGDGRDVAIKVLRSLDKKAWDRFERERRIVSLLGQDAGFVQCIEVVETTRSPALVMPFLSGGTLRDRLTRGPYPIDEALSLARSLAGALARAHERGIVHRDIKPENILFAADGRPFVADLGIAKHFREDAEGASQTVALTRSHTVLGTVSYMPPEQIQDAKRAGPAAD
ncbi:MAG: serine/threonine-protein kinase, partial [Planctomycetota bacterium]